MSEPADLLPPNATALERAEAKSVARISDVPVTLRDLWSPQTCPADLLPYLAWGFSVDRWDPAWRESSRRNAVADAYYVHAHKGTISALRRVVEPLGYLFSITEWWQQDPVGTPGTFAIDIGVADQGIGPESAGAIQRLLDDAKPVSRTYDLVVSLQTTGPGYFAAAAALGDTLTVYPYEPGPITVTGPGYAGAGVHTIDTVSIDHE